MRLGTCLLYEGHTLQGAPTKLAYFCSAPVAGFYAAVDMWTALNQPAKACEKPTSKQVTKTPKTDSQKT